MSYKENDMDWINEIIIPAIKEFYDEEENRDLLIRVY
jgi:hypothetical protein